MLGNGVEVLKFGDTVVELLAVTAAAIGECVVDVGKLCSPTRPLCVNGWCRTV